LKHQHQESFDSGHKIAGQIVRPHVKYIAVVKKGPAGAGSLTRIFWRKTLANIKSQIKRNRQNESRRLRNRNVRGAARTAVNQARTAFEANEPETKEAILKAISTLDKAAEKGVIHKNNAARRKGRLMKKLASFENGTSAANAQASKAKKSSK
jgi:small subunit ribosomal protein S20